jgi:hypothetical protein
MKPRPSDRACQALRDLEWVQHEGEMGSTPAFCPSCDAWETDGHREGCELNALLYEVHGT